MPKHIGRPMSGLFLEGSLKRRTPASLAVIFVGCDRFVSCNKKENTFLLSCISVCSEFEVSLEKVWRKCEGILEEV